MRFMALIMFLLLSCSSPPVDEPAMMPPPSQVWLYLLIGQSNMAGRAALDNQAFKTHRRVAVLKEKGWMLATDPLHNDNPLVGVGPGLSFGKAIASRNPDVTIGLIPAAVGGTHIAEWQKGGPLYAQALAKVAMARQSGILKGILWHQGEQDAFLKTSPEEYARLLRQLFTDLESDLGPVPIIAGELPNFLKYPHDAINQAIHTVDVPIVSLADLRDLGDSIHLDTRSQRELGRRYADAMLSAPRLH